MSAAPRRFVPTVVAPCSRIFLGALALASPALAELGFELVDVFGSDPEEFFSSVAADLDGDGDLDVLYSTAAGVLGWRENWDGSAIWGPPRVIHQSGQSVRSALAVDVDGDGDLDAATGKPLAWFENVDGLGHFGPLQALGGASNHIAAGDVNGDGAPDLVVLGSAGAGWLENLGGAGFGPEVPIAAGRGVGGGALADLDGDGDLDLLRLRDAGIDVELVLHENTDGSGGFGPGQVLLSTENTAFDPADLDGDGDRDILLGVGKSLSGSSGTPRQLAWLENDGTGGFSGIQTLLLTLNIPELVRAEDVDGDGDADLLYVDDATRWLENLGNLTLGAIQTISFQEPEGLSLPDLDGDGDGDLLFHTSDEFVAPESISWFANTGGLGAFGVACEVSWRATTSSALLVDIDVDGDDDLVAVGGSTGVAKIVWYENADGAGDFGGPERTLALLDFSGGVLRAGDLDGDGDADLLIRVSSNELGVDFLWYENLGARGSFSSAREVDEEMVFATPPVLADLDGDGDLDVAAGSAWSTIGGNAHEVFWYENEDGLGDFGPKQLVWTYANQVTDITAPDLDSDGFPDLLVQSFDENRVSWFANTDGLGTFGAEQVIQLQAQANGVHVADMDGDGDLDLLKRVASPKEIHWYENLDGLGGFAPPAFFVDANGPTLVTVDIDLDGDLDVLATDTNGIAGNTDLLSFEHWDGLGTFGPPEEIAEATDRVMVWDRNGDGAMDLIRIVDEAFHFYENAFPCVSPGPAQEVVRLGSPPNPHALMPGKTGAAVLCKTWRPFIDHTTFVPYGGVLDFLLVCVLPANLPSPPNGTFLCDLSSLVLVAGGPIGTTFSIPVPSNCSLVGVSLTAQGGSAGAVNQFMLTNALDITIGTSTSH